MSRRYPGRKPLSGDDDLPDLDALSNLDERTSAGMIGFILSIVSLGLLLVVAVLWYALSLENGQQQNAERTRLMVYWFAVVDIGSFFIAVAATVFAARGLSPSTSLYPGWSTAALILGLSEIAITTIVGLFLFCCVGWLEIARNGG